MVFPTGLDQRAVFPTGVGMNLISPLTQDRYPPVLRYTALLSGTGPPRHRPFSVDRWPSKKGWHRLRVQALKKIAGGGCEIRTHGPLRVGSFQDCWFKPLTQASGSVCEWGF